MRKTILALLACASLSAPAFADKVNVKPGQWEVTVKAEMEGSPMQIPPHTLARCVKAEEAKDPAALIKASNERQRDCEVKDVKQTGNKITFTMSCGAKGTGSGELTYAETSYDLVMTMHIAAGGGQRNFKSTVHAQRTGDACTSP